MHHRGDNPWCRHNTVNREMRMSENSHQPKSSHTHTVFNKLCHRQHGFRWWCMRDWTGSQWWERDELREEVQFVRNS